MLIKPNLNKVSWVILPQWKKDIVEDRCPECKKPIVETEFQTEISKLEYSVSGLCPICQDSYFKKQKEEWEQTFRKRETPL